MRSVSASPTIALVLGAGGVVGGAYEIGVLAALDEHLGWDARDADLMVGTSAGASIAATLRIGFSPSDHFAHATEQPMSPAGRELAAGLPTERLELPDIPPRRGLPVPMAPQLVVPALCRFGSFRPALALAGILPRGNLDTGPIGARVRHVHRDRWTAAPTWLCAVRVRDGRRVVFGRDDVDTPDLATAVEASCAIAGYFRPVRVGAHEYIDGGVWSVTNGDLVAGLGFDLAVVVSPMAVVPAGPPWSPLRLGRRLYAGNRAGETDGVRRRGTVVLDLSPTPEIAARLGSMSLDTSRAADAARHGFDATARALDDHAAGSALATLRRATPNASRS
jgi:NTE family protein